MSCRDRLDWVAKKYLLTTFQEAEGLEWSDPWLQSIDLEYHNVSLEQGLYYELVRSGQMRRFVTEDEVRRAIFQPPDTTRAFFRGRAVARFNQQISSIQWDGLTFQRNGQEFSVDLPHPVHDARLAKLNDLIRENGGFHDFAQRVAALDP